MKGEVDNILLMAAGGTGNTVIIIPVGVMPRKARQGSQAGRDTHGIVI